MEKLSEVVEEVIPSIKVEKELEELCDTMEEYVEIVDFIKYKIDEINKTEKKSKLSFKIMRKKLQEIIDKSFSIVETLSKDYNNVSYKNFIENTYDN